ncbi:1-phosphofructokinase family hexose kinase [Brachybacterium hainanense]|uniref:1-phosphofructokinase family hexose kinase n=1 Tax=Brachybacterium hainanense TaxID=1541174 RepID=A0ABV6R5W8_9MICO
MILALTPNPALDITETLTALSPGAVHRPEEVRAMPGGKGLNTARVLDALGEAVTVLGPLGGATGRGIRTLLAEASPRIVQGFVEIGGETRRTVTLLARGEATGIHEQGPELHGSELDALEASVLHRLPGARALGISGSLPRGMGDARLSALVAAARAARVPVLVDTSGPALLAAARAGADVLKPNREEALAATGATDPSAACRALLDLGAGSVVCSLGPDGMLVASRDGRLLRARPPRSIAGNPTGAGDAAVAALLRHLARARSPHPAPVTADALVDAVATSASALARPVAGEIDPDLRAALLAEIRPETCTPLEMR